jgi:hypothetical protein
LEPSATPSPDLGQYIILGSGTRADIFASTGILARMLEEVTDTKLAPAARAVNLAEIIDPMVTPDILTRALRNLLSDISSGGHGSAQPLRKRCESSPRLLLMPSVK